jgi:hypothetical protein
MTLSDPNPRPTMADKKNHAQTAKITKNEAVRRALAALGRDAKLAALQAWIMQHFGHEMSTNHISTSKGDILRKEAGKDKPAAKKPAPKGTTSELQAAPAPTAPPTANGHRAPAGPSSAPARINKTDAMRQALGELGRDAKPAPIQAFLKDRFNLEMSTQLVYKYKSDLKAAKKPAAKKAGPKKRAPEPAVQPSSANTSPAQGGKAKGGILLADVLAVKFLVQRLGRDQLRGLIAAFAN